MKIDWFRSLIIASLLVLFGNFFFMISQPLDYPKPEISISPYTGTIEMDARVYGLRGDDIGELPVVIESGKRDRFRAIMEAYSSSYLVKVESLRVNDAYEDNNRIYLDVGRNSFSHPGVQEENIQLHVQAIVNSLTSNDRQRPVQFLFDGSILAESIKTLSFQQPFWRDETVLGYNRGHMREMVAEFLTLVEEENYARARHMIYLSDQDRITEGELMQKLRSYRQAKKETIPRQIEVYSEGDSFLIQVHFADSGQPENWNVKIIDKLYYILYTNSPLDR
jgi:hypothetical protein